MRSTGIAAIVLGLAAMAWAQADHSASHPSEPAEAKESAHVSTEPQPALSSDAAWAGPLVLGIVGLFAVAIPVGILVRANAPEDAPVADSHDNPAAHPDAHHGHH